MNNELSVAMNPECQRCRSLQSDLSAANRDLADLNAKLVDAIHWRDQYRRELETIRRGVDTTQMGE